MADYYSIPLDSGSQSFTVTLGGTVYSVLLMWRNSASGAGWYLDFVPANGEGVRGIPLVFGIDLFKQFPHLGIGHLYTRLTGTQKNTPEYSDVGDQLILAWSADDE